MLPKFNLPDIGLPNGLNIGRMNNAVCIFDNGRMVGTLDESSNGVHVSIEDDTVYAELVFSSLERAIEFVVKKGKNLIDIV